ncbi:unnamed protein product [Rhizophagus irregularis]|uniref:Uncharacterized protein n=1 Tax=Rhizophagus irregularis TaxID=588596 RepID=A0A915ZWI8_9GLOM|nr:unnamed protein product [Rhizophagus irregularis]CAB5389832.1 unnamed protein product [Rhizophagus irregularis]
MSSTQNGALNMPTNSNVMSRRNVNNRERQNQLMRRRIINKLQQKCSQLNNTPIDNQDMLDPNSSMDFHFKLGDGNLFYIFSWLSIGGFVVLSIVFQRFFFSM